MAIPEAKYDVSLVAAKPMVGISVVVVAHGWVDGAVTVVARQTFKIDTIPDAGRLAACGVEGQPGGSARGDGLPIVPAWAA